MQLKSVKKYLSKLIQDGHKWQYLGINGIGDKPRFFFTSLQWILLLISIVSFYFLSTGFNSDFVGYLISALSIFVGLFLTLILSVFDKFKALENVPQATELDVEYKTQRTNFFKQFTALTGYAIIIAILCILLLSITYMTGVFKVNIFHQPFVWTTFKQFITNLHFFKLLFIAIYNIVIIYFLLDFLLIVVYAVTSIHAYMMIEYNK